MHPSASNQFQNTVDFQRGRFKFTDPRPAAGDFPERSCRQRLTDTVSVRKRT